METYFPQLSLINPNDQICSSCNTSKLCISFICKHNWCDNCFCEQLKNKLKNCIKALRINPESLNGKYSYIGCIMNCEESKLALPVEWVEELFINRNEQEIANLLSICRTFFSGIPTYFKNCDQCNATHSGVSKDVKCINS
ncbi:hypothetical protein SteCoe_31254 [Stentor coeruleus]|uniref:Uncharacterized protein n=1 Tax=Stentor coeruleus TaxID=5963 RepID=A0A1R2B1N8_9CILI|nr:hypothetical protein SteCoe_31254 [Stentor coeruleus]